MKDYGEFIIGFFFFSGLFFWWCILAGFIYSLGKEFFILGKGDL